MRNLAGIFLRGRITKGAQTSNWAAPTLTFKQITYAATDAWACRELYLKFATLGLLTAALAVSTPPRERRAPPPTTGPH